MGVGWHLLYLVFCNEGLHLFNFLGDGFFILITKRGFSPLQPSQQSFQQLLFGNEPSQSTC